MIQARYAILLLAIVFWDAWRLLVGRIGDGAEAIPIILLLAGFVVTWNRLKPDRLVPVILICSLLVAFIAASILGTAMIKIGAALASIVLVVHRGLGGEKPPFAAIGIGLLLLPILPSLDFYLAWPMRQLSAILTAGLLRLNGFSVSVEGVAIAWQDQLLLFDGPCSGIRMLWAALLLTSLLSLIGRLEVWRYGAALILTVVLAIFANALRAASLFYLETGFVPRMEGAFFHELVGISSFALLGMLLVFLFHRHNEGLRPCA